MVRPSVAILMSNYNHARYLRESLGGICGQTRPADEIIVIDDASTDHSAKIIAEFAAQYPAMRFMQNEVRLGVQDSIARALPLVNADYLVWTAADDRLLPHFLEKSMAMLERHPQAGLCFSETTELRGDGGETVRFAAEPSVAHIFELRDLPEYMSPDDMVRRMKRAYLPIAANTVVVRRDILLAQGGYLRQLEWHADYFTYYVIALRHGACVIAEPLALIRATPSSYSKAMNDPERQTIVLNAILELLASAEYRDVRRIFRRCPSNFSPWHALMLKLQLRRVRDWDLFFPYLIWKIREYKRGHKLSWLRALLQLSEHLAQAVRRRIAERISRILVRHPPPHLVAEIEHFKSRLNAAIAVREHIEKQLNTTELELHETSTERDRFARRVGDLEAERDGAANELERTRGVYAAEKVVLSTALEQVRRELRAVGVERARLAGRLGDLEAELKAAAIELDRTRREFAVEKEALVAAIKEVRGELQVARDSRDRLAQRLGDLEAERAGAANELQRTRGELHAVDVERNRLARRLGDLEAERAGAANELQRMRGELHAAGEEGNRLTAERDGLANELERVRAETTGRDIKPARSRVSRRADHSAEGAHRKSQHTPKAVWLPPMLITTMPKSGTYYISKLFGGGLSIRTRIVSHQYFPEDVIRQPELRELSRGNCISQDHFGASKINLTHISRHVDRMIVHLRDPRQALLSYVHYLDTAQFRKKEKETLLFIYPPLPDDFYQLGLTSRIDWAIENWLPHLVQWTEEWVEAVSLKNPLRIKFTRYEDLVADRDKFVSDVLGFFSIPLERFTLPDIAPDPEIHFRKGEIDEWMQVFSPAQAAAANARTPPELASRFGWPMRKA